MKKAFNLLDANQVEYEFRNVKNKPLDVEELHDLVKVSGLDMLINRKGMMWRKLGLGKMNLNEQQLFEKLLEHQNMIKRPVLLREDGEVHVGFSEEKIQEFVS